MAVADDDVRTENSDTVAVSIADSESAGLGRFLWFEVSRSETPQQDVTVTFVAEPIAVEFPLTDYCILPSGEEPDPDFRCFDLRLREEYEHGKGELTIAAGEDGGAIHIWIDRDTKVQPGQPHIWVVITEVEGATEGTRDRAVG